MPHYEYNCKKCGTIEIFHGIMEGNKKVCPECKTRGLKKLISGAGAVIIKGRAANQYEDIKQAKYWRDHNGVRHKVTSGDGHSGSGTPSKKQIRTPEEVAAIKKRADHRRKQQRTEQSYRKFAKQQRARKR